MIVYDPDQVEGELTSFADFWREDLTDSVWLINDARVSIGAALRSMGYSYNTTNEEELAAVSEKLESLKQNVRVLDYDMTYNYLSAGEVKAAYLFTPYVIMSLFENPNLVAVFPEEGIGFGIDSIVIPKNAPHPENANLFLNYLMDAQVAATTVEWQYYCSTNKAAMDVVADWYKNNIVFTGIYERIDDGEYIMNLGAEETKFHDIWTEFKLLF